MSTITEVSAALIRKDGKILIARRGPGEKHAGGWEFPGGKREAGETFEECLRRELWEEFSIEARIGAFFAESIYAYPSGTVRLMAFYIAGFHGELRLSVHDRYAFVTAPELADFDLLPADRPLAERLLQEEDNANDAPLTH